LESSTPFLSEVTVFTRFRRNDPFLGFLAELLQKSVPADQVCWFPAIPHKCIKQFVGCSHRLPPVN
jgi:hypothetical protein